MNTTLALLFVVFSVIANGFFAGVETGVTSARRVRLLHWARQGRWGARAAASLLRKREQSIVAAVVGNNVAVVAGTSVATAWAVEAIGSQGEAIAASAMAILNIVFGEVLPKSLFRARPESLLRGSAGIFIVCNYVLWPLRIFATFCARAVLWLAGERGAVRERGVTRESLVAMFAFSRARRQLDEHENHLLASFVTHVHRPVAQCMTPMENVTRLPLSATVADALDTVRSTGHSRLPVTGEGGECTGLLVFHDLVGLDRTDPVEPKVRDLLRLPAKMSLDEAIGTLTDRQVSLAVVVDESGHGVGVVTLEDLLEPFVGDIDDEHDTDDLLRES